MNDSDPSARKGMIRKGFKFVVKYIALKISRGWLADQSAEACAGCLQVIAIFENDIPVPSFCFAWIMKLRSIKVVSFEHDSATSSGTASRSPFLSSVVSLASVAERFLRTWDGCGIGTLDFSIKNID